MPTFKPKPCAYCRQAFVPTGPAAKFCSANCRLTAMHGDVQCAHCGKRFLPRVPSKVKPQLFCSRACAYDHRVVEGTRRLHKDSGYMLAKVPRGTPGVQGDRQWMIEHRYVMQQAVGRPLLPSETVHHINGDKTDNRLENLQLRQGRHGKGAQFTCLDCGSHNVGAAPLP